MKRDPQPKYFYYVGIDTGVNTGYAVWSKKDKMLLDIRTVKIHQAMQMLSALYASEKRILVRIEDARIRKWVQGGREKLQGAGSIKRDAKIWEDFLRDSQIDFELVPPKQNRTKLDESLFKNLTNWIGRTSEHARDAAMLVYGY